MRRIRTDAAVDIAYSTAAFELIMGKEKSVMNKKIIAIIALTVVIALVAALIIIFATDGKPRNIKFSEFLAMSPAEQQAYMESYDDIMDFLEWYRVAEEKYKSEQAASGTENNGDIDIDIGDYVD